MNKLQMVELLNNYSVACKESRHFHAGEVALRRAIHLDPTASVLWANLGVMLWNLNRVVEAEESIKYAIQLRETHEQEHAHLITSPLANLGLFHASLQNWDEAEQLLVQAAEIEPKNLTPKWDLACMYLEKGDWEKGFEIYEIRKETKKFGKFPFPLWNGEDLSNKTIYIQAEQGMGDRFLFSRYLYWLKDKYPTCKIIFLADPDSVSLMWGFKELDILEFLPNNVPWPQADYGIYLMTLPKFHGSRPDFVVPDPGLIRARVQKIKHACKLPPPRMKSLKVGISWTGNPVQDLNPFRSIPFEKMLEFAEHSRVTLYGLQVGAGQEDIKKFNANDLIMDLSPELTKAGFLGSAQAMMNMDLVITVCTSVAHLAGVLGVPCWLLLSRNGYWVWLSPDKNINPDPTKSIWYPENFTIFRQTIPGDWNDVIAEVKSKLFEKADSCN